ncbi:hypothetical protein BDV29DRAFT_161953 [Aspergillus leporis]|jgi:hypothetical protein|uniref:Uncharacterized protein n=1 Tax=Aspergillus leporis TaxID=41062 RepID=A0A5N5WK58_9EURO|nr:hypothetical protein BDV29DRAFT_161953 [Aspergillus leporis]
MSDAQGKPTPSAMSKDNHLIRYYYSVVEIGVMKVFIDYGIFPLIPTNSSDRISLLELSPLLKAGYNLLGRLSNFLVAAKVLSSPRPSYTAQRMDDSPNFPA